MDLRAPLLLLLLCVCGVQANKVILPAGPLEVLEGATATFRTLLKNPEFVVIAWAFNDGTDLHSIAMLLPSVLNVGEKYRGRASIDSDGTLTLSAVTAADAGTYSISITDKRRNTRVEEIELRVTGGRPNDVILPPGPVRALEGLPATFRTLLKNPEFVVISWSFNDGQKLHHVAKLISELLSVDDKYTGRASIDSNGTLTLSDSTPDDNGVYSISITDKLGTTRTSETELQVTGGRPNDDILPKGPLEVLEGATATFRTLLKNPEFEVITWTFSDETKQNPIATMSSELLSIDDKYLGRASIDSSGVLTLSAVTPDDSGEYGISITDKLGNVRSAQIQLRVQVNNDIIPKGPLEAQAGATATFRTLLKNPDFASILWTFNDAKQMTPIATLLSRFLSINDKYKGRANIDSSGALTLSGVTPDDSGVYGISFTDKRGIIRSAEIELRVTDVQVSDDILPEGPLEALEGTTATFRTLLKNPDFVLITWSFSDGKEVSPIATLIPEVLNIHEKYIGRANVDSNGTLTLSAVTPDDSGEYHISIIDKRGNTRSAQIQLRVTNVQVSDVILPEGPLEALAGLPATFRTLLKNPDFTVITWTFSAGEEMSPIATLTSTLLNINHKYIGRANVDPSGTLALSAVTPDDSGEYRIGIVDKRGKVRSAQIQLRVTG